MEGKVLDLQCRSMLENLIFTGIDEVEPERSSSEESREDSEAVLLLMYHNPMSIMLPTK